jgi:hypothetical protein
VRSFTDIFVSNVRLFILLQVLLYFPDHRLTLALVAHPPGLYGLYSTSRTGPRASRRRCSNTQSNQTPKKQKRMAQVLRFCAETRDGCSRSW